MTMWIVLGSLVGVVVIFLIVTTTLDRKKNKAKKIESDSLKQETLVASPNIAKKITSIISENKKDIKQFIPSVGKLKMSDINNKAKEALRKIKSSREFKILKNDKEVFDVFDEKITLLINEKSNNWEKRNMKEIDFFAKYKPKVVDDVDSKKSKDRKPKIKKGKK